MALTPEPEAPTTEELDEARRERAAILELIARVVFATIATAAFIAAGFMIHAAAGWVAVALMNGYGVYLLTPDNEDDVA